MVTEVIKTIHPLGSGDYLTLDDWNNDRHGDIVLRDTIEIAEFIGSTQHNYGTVLAASGWTVDANHYIIIRARAGEDHAGVFNRKNGYLSLLTSIDVQVGYTRIGPGLSIYPNLDIGNPVPIVIQNIFEDTPVIVDRCIIHRYGDSVIYINNCSGVTGHCIKNCILLTATGTVDGIVAAGTGTKVSAYNNTIVMDNYCLYASDGASIISENNILYTRKVGTPACYKTITGGSITKGDNDTTNTDEAVTVSNRNISIKGGNVYFWDEGVTGWHENETGIADWHLPPNSFFRNKGANLSGITPSTFIPNVGIDSRTRTSWDIGADEFTTPTKITKHIGIGKDYTTLAAWASGRKGNLATRDTVEEALVHDSVGRLILNEEEWGVNYKNYISIKAAPGAEHGGIFRTDRAYIKMPDGLPGGSKVIVCNVGGTHIGPGLVIDGTASVSSGFDSHIGISLAYELAAPVILDGLICKIGNNGGNWAPTIIQSAGVLNYNKHWDTSYIHSTCIIKNCILYAPFSQYGYGAYLTAGVWAMKNNTVYVNPGTNSYALYFGTGFTTQFQDINNYLYSRINYGTFGSGTKCYNTATQNNEAATSGLRNVLFTTDNFFNVTSGSEDFHIQKTSILNGAGIFDADARLDIDGDARPNPPSIGADDYPISAGGLFFVMY